MSEIINLQTKRANINMVEKILSAQQAIAKLDQAELQIKAISIEDNVPILRIETPEDNHPIYNESQTFGTYDLVPKHHFGRLDHYIMWVHPSTNNTRGANQ
ncbi:MAG: hypothetical protein GXO35_07710 [Gammaproteobacteria bacterium]|nr:hypothetical protein [Gammaproteobacteria bacterium]